MHRHHLLDEAKAEVDVVFEEIRRVEAAQPRAGTCEIVQLWRLQTETVQRFDAIARAFAAASAAPDAGLAAEHLLASLFPDGVDADAVAAAHRFCSGLRAFRDGAIAEDARVRTAWSTLESRLTG